MSVINNLPQKYKSHLKHLYLVFCGGGVKKTDNGKNNKLIVGKNCDLRNTVLIFNGDNNTFQIEDNVTLRNSKVVFAGNNNTGAVGNNCSIHDAFMFFVDDDNVFSMGAANAFDGNVRIVIEEGTTVAIGEKCQVAINVAIRSSDGHSVISSISNERINPAQNVTIGDRCWIGENVKILKGAQIKSDCVIGAGAIVTKGNYESNSLYVGNPASRIKKDVHWLAERI